MKKILLIASLVAVFGIALTGGLKMIYAETATLDPFPSTNDSNKEKGQPYVEFVSHTTNSVTLKLINPVSPDKKDVWFEYRKDNSAPGTNQWNPCRIGNEETATFKKSCPGAYLAADDYSYSAQSVPDGESLEFTFDGLTEKVSIRMTFGPERDWDFNWVSFYVKEVPDTEAPQIIFRAPALNEVVGNTNLSFTLTDNVAIKQYSFEVRGPAYTWNTFVSHPDLESVSIDDFNLCSSDRLPIPKKCDENKLISGEYTVLVRAYDAAGNRNISSSTKFVLDKEGPTVTITSPAKDSSVEKVLVNAVIEDQKLDFFNIELKNINDTNWSFITQKIYVDEGVTSHTLSDFDLLGAAWYGTCDGQPCTTWDKVNALTNGEYQIRINAYDQFANRTIYAHKFFLGVEPSSDVTTLDIPTLISPADNSIVSGKTLTNEWTEVLNAIKYEYQSYHDAEATQLRWKEVYTTTSKIATNVADAVFYWKVRAIDNNDVTSDWSPLWKVTVDNQAPSAPTNLSWKTSTNEIIVNGGTTDQEEGMASWTASDSNDVDYYIYKYWNDISDSEYKVGNEWPSIADTSLPGVFDQGEGTHYFCVVAVDMAGNKSECSETFTITFNTQSAPGGNNGGGDIENPAPTVLGNYFVAKAEELNVGFSVKNLTNNASSVKVSLYDADNNLITENIGNTQVMVDLLNTNPTEISSPFWIPTKANDEYWNFGTPDWKNANKPSYAIVTLTYNTGEEVASDKISFISPDELGNNWEALIASLPEDQNGIPTTPVPTGRAGGGLAFTTAYTTPSTTLPQQEGRVLGATAFQFTKDLKFGSVHDEVLALQKFLNLKGFTVATSGAGSLGNETRVFGPKTKAAVIKYQEANPVILTNVEILDGKGTGNFFWSTRGFVNDVLLNDSVTSAALEN